MTNGTNQLPIKTPNGKIITPAAADPDVEMYRALIQHHLGLVAAYERRLAVKVTTAQMRAWYKRQMQT